MNYSFRVLILIVFSVLMLGAIRTRIDNSPASWINENSETELRRQERIELFGPDETINLYCFDRDPFDESVWKDQVELTRKLETLPFVSSVTSLPNLLQTMMLDPLLPPPVGIDNLLKQMESVDGNLIGENGKSFSIIANVNLDPTLSRKEMLTKVQSILPEGNHWEIAGPIMFNVGLDELVQTNMKRIGVVIVVLTILFGFYYFRSFTGLLFSVISTVLPIGVWLGISGWLGASLNGAQLAAFPFLAMIGIETWIHLWVESKSLSISERSFTKAAESLGRPLFYSMATTVLSLMAFMLSSFPYLRLMGITLPLSVFCGWLWCRYLAPPLLDRFYKITETTASVHRVLPRFSRPVTWSIIFVSCMVGVMGLLSVKTEANIALQLSDQSDLRVLVDRIDANFSGSMVLDIVSDSENIESEIQDAFDADAKVLDTELWQSELRAMASLNQQNIPAEYLINSSPFQHGDEFLTTIIVPQIPGAELESARESLEENGLHLTGTVSDMLLIQHQILHEIGLSFSLSILAVAICIGFFLKSVKRGIYALIVNLFPFLITLTIFAITGWNIDMSNAQLFSMLFGFVVNSTVIMIASLNEPAAVLAHRSSSIIISGVAGTALFVGLIFSNMPSLQHFGVLAGLTIAAACFADVILLPSLDARKKNAVE